VVGLGSQRKRIKPVFIHHAQTPQPVSMTVWQHNCIGCVTERYRLRKKKYKICVVRCCHYLLHMCFRQFL
jgi:hypothetical protein